MKSWQDFWYVSISYSARRGSDKKKARHHWLAFFSSISIITPCTSARPGSIDQVHMILIFNCRTAIADLLGSVSRVGCVEYDGNNLMDVEAQIDLFTCLWLASLPVKSVTTRNLSLARYISKKRPTLGGKSLGWVVIGETTGNSSTISLEPLECNLRD